MKTTKCLIMNYRVAQRQRGEPRSEDMIEAIGQGNINLGKF